jgi:hypothetical protein
LKSSSSKYLAAARLDAQLDKLLVSHWSIARWARRICSPGDLPARLQHCIRYLAKGTAWCAYADDRQVYFILGRLHPPTPPAGEPLVEAYFLDAAATLLFRGVWELDPLAGFEPRRSVAASSTRTKLSPEPPPIG